VAKPPKAFDVWFVAANTVYKAVPYNVVADWTQQGRLAAADMVRPSGTEQAWERVSDYELLADYLPRPSGAKAAPAQTAGEGAVARVATPAGTAVITERTAAAEEPVELPEPEAAPPPSRFEEDDEVDMIPLIDISMVLLVFFIIVSATGALSPVDVPDMRYAGEFSADAEAVTINIEKASETDVFYSVRVGQLAPKPEHSRLPTPEAAMAALDSVLSGLTRPPVVRVACEKDLPSERVLELARELKKRMDRHLINSFEATVNEAPKNQ
jgi:biopolymer transport protein ExbD